MKTRIHINLSMKRTLLIPLPPSLPPLFLFLLPSLPLPLLPVLLLLMFFFLSFLHLHSFYLSALLSFFHFSLHSPFLLFLFSVSTISLFHLTSLPSYFVHLPSLFFPCSPFFPFPFPCHPLQPYSILVFFSLFTLVHSSFYFLTSFLLSTLPSLPLCLPLFYSSLLSVFIS